MKYLILMLCSFSVMASGQHEHTPNITNITQEYITNVVNKYDLPKCNGGASGIAAAQINQEFDTNSLQWGIGAANYNDCNAIAGGLSWKVNKVLFSGTITRDNDSTGVGIGFNGRF